MSAWPGMLRLAASLGIAPEAFWRLSLTEWRWLTGGGDAAALTATGLAGLMALYPDGEA